MILGETCGEIENPLHEWNVTFPPIPKPPVKIQNLPKEGGKVFKILQITDTHYDPHYEEGSIANCQEPLCCRNFSTPPENESIPIEYAGK